MGKLMKGKSFGAVIGTLGIAFCLDVPWLTEDRHASGPVPHSVPLHIL